MSEQNIEKRKHRLVHNIAVMMGSDTLWLGMSAVVCGVGAATVNHHFNWVMFVMVFMFAILIQSTGNCLHYYTELKRDTGHVHPKLVIDDMPSIEVYKVSYTCFTIMALTVGFCIMGIAGWWLIAFGIVVWALIWLMYYGKTALVATPYSIIITFLLFGPVGVMGTCLAMMPDAMNEIDERITMMPAVWMSLICGFMASSCHLLFNYMSYDSDLKEHRRTFSTVTGKEFTRAMFLVFGFIVTGLLVVMAYGLPNVPNYGPGWWVIVATAVLFLLLRLYVYKKMPATSNTFIGDMRFSVDVMSFFIAVVLAITLTCIGYR